MVKLLNAGEHLSCPNYDTGQYPAIEEVRVAAGEIRQVHPKINKLVFVLEGQAEYSTGPVQRSPVRRGDIFFLSTGRNLWYKALKDTKMLVVRLHEKIRFCDCLSVEDLHKMENEKLKTKNEKLKELTVENEKLEMKNEETTFAEAKVRQLTVDNYQLKANNEKPTADNEKPFHLGVNEVMEKYLDILILCYGAGLRCRYYHEGKIRELMYIFRAFYPKQDLRRFFAPALAIDARFSQLVMSSYSRYGNLAEIASSMNYTVSGFEKKFRKVFGCSPYNWMVRQKAQEAWHWVNTSDMNLKEIADKFGFSSSSSFGKFFRQHFGVTPGQARANIKKGGIGA